LLLEFGVLSHLTNDSVFYDVAERSLFELWRRRNHHTGLLGNALDARTGEWRDENSGTGAGIDSFYEYALKSHLLFGNVKWLHLYQTAMQAVHQFVRNSHGWYVTSHMGTGQTTGMQHDALSNFLPGLQTLAGDVPLAATNQQRHFGVWERFGSSPERFLLLNDEAHPSERHYVLRPELVESAYYLYRATHHRRWLDMGVRMLDDIARYCRVEHGFAGLRDVHSKELDDKQHSFFFAETLKYLYLLFGNTSAC
jgi:mannosidase alpha-like ER degradation enhancer 1